MDSQEAVQGPPSGGPHWTHKGWEAAAQHRPGPLSTH